MNLEYMKVSLSEISYKKRELFHDILIFWDAPVYMKSLCTKIDNVFYKFLNHVFLCYTLIVLLC